MTATRASRSQEAEPGALTGADVGSIIRQRLLALGMSQAEMCRLVGEDLGEPPVVQSAVTRWLADASMIARHRLFAIERVLGFAPGTLTRPLGYLPVEAVGTLDVRSAITADARLSQLSKDILQGVYESLLVVDRKARRASGLSPVNQGKNGTERGDHR